MKLAAALVIAVAVAARVASGVVVRQQSRPDELPWTVKAQPWAMSRGTFEGTTETITFRVRNFYQQAQGVTNASNPNYRLTGRANFFGVYFTMKPNVTHLHGWRARVTNASVTFPMNATIHTGADPFVSMRWDFEKRGTRARELRTLFHGLPVYATSDGVTNFTSAKMGSADPPRLIWGPCSGSADWTNNQNTGQVGMNFRVLVDLYGPPANKSLPDGTPWSIVFGQPVREAVATYDLEWSRCDPKNGTIQATWDGT